MKRIVWLALIFVPCIGCDQVTKYAAQRTLEGTPTQSHFADLLRLSYTENAGAFLGLGSSLPQEVRTGIFVVGVFFLLAAAAIFLVRSRFLSPGQFVAGTMVVAGGASNLIDRAFRDGAVIDFLNIGWGPVRTGIFNVADMAITFGALLLFFSMCRKNHAPREVFKRVG